MRTEAVKRGLNPDKWFNNVEIVVGEKIGIETTTYVRNIYKYYVAYKLTVDAQDAVRKARERFAPNRTDVRQWMPIALLTSPPAVCPSP